jgi:superfamily II DNA/RNA helicase
MYTQIQELRRNPHVVIGTPGRLKDLIERKALKLETFRMIVLDEADQMLDMGFIQDVKHIISFLPAERQSLFFSATLSPAINALIQSFVKNPVTVSVKKQETVTNIKQEVIHVEPTQKRAKLAELLKQDEYKKVMVFGRTKMGVENLSRALYEQGFKVAAIHGDRPQFQRQQAIRMFKEDVVQILVATDVAARGIDIEDVTHVINYEIPDTYDDYIHRIGRTGRANKLGVAITFADPSGSRSVSSARPAYSSARPAYSSSRPAYSSSRPSYGSARPQERSYGRTRPSYYRADRVEPQRQRGFSPAK